MVGGSGGTAALATRLDGCQECSKHSTPQSRHRPSTTLTWWHVTLRPALVRRRRVRAGSLRPVASHHARSLQARARCQREDDMTRSRRPLLSRPQVHSQHERGPRVTVPLTDRGDESLLGPFELHRRERVAAYARALPMIADKQPGASAITRGHVFTTPAPAVAELGEGAQRALPRRSSSCGSSACRPGGP